MDSDDRAARPGWYHRHFSRRKFIAGAAAVSAGAVVGSQLPTVAHAAPRRLACTAPSFGACS